MKFVRKAFRTPRIFYETRIDAMDNRQQGERTFYEATKGYYNVKAKKREWWIAGF